MTDRHVIRLFPEPRSTWCTHLNPSHPVPANTTIGSRMDRPWTLTPHQILVHFQVDSTTGLSRSQIAKYKEIHGPNGAHPHFYFSCQEKLTFILNNSSELLDEPPTPIWELVLDQFKDQLVLILLASALVSFVLALVESQEDGSLLGAFVEPLVILLILVANATVGVIQETNAEKAIDVCVLTLLLRLCLYSLDCPRLSRNTLPTKQRSFELAKLSVFMLPSSSLAI